MKVKHLIVLLVISFLFTFTGALFKLEHWPSAGKLLITGMILKGIVLILFVIKILKTDKFRDFLNS